jgi:hypothetical protein
MTTTDNATIIEEQAIKQVSGDAENVSGGSQPMLCPPGCGAVVAGGLASGYIAGRELYGDSSWADTDHELRESVSNDASVGEIITAIDEQ